jgi:methyl-accepting chemotaxis protein
MSNFLESSVQQKEKIELLYRTCGDPCTDLKAKEKTVSSAQLKQSLEAKRKSLISVLALWQIGFTALVFIMCIFLTHKVAGPLFKLQKFFTAIAEGGDNGRLFFRSGDYFTELADSYNDAINQLKEDYKNDFVYLSEVSAYINNLSLVVPDDKKAVLNEINKRLTEIQGKFNEKS